MAFHLTVQRLILLGADLRAPFAPGETVAPPARLRPLIESLAGAKREFDAHATLFGDRYRSSFWGIYLLSAFAVLCALMPLALGLEDVTTIKHPFAAFWGITEIAVIGAIAFLYWRGHRKGWQGQWLRSRTLAEYIAYLPLIAPLVDHSRPGSGSWYMRAMPVCAPQAAIPEIVSLCTANDPPARQLLEGAAQDPAFVRAYGQWAAAVLKSQLDYHVRLARRSHALRHRINRLTATLFLLTALAALTHLYVHSLWLSLLTTFCPALAAALHGALAQSEAYRLEASSRMVTRQLEANILAIAGALNDSSRPLQLEQLRAPIEAALTVILQEHQDWYMLVQPHHLPLA